MICKLVDWKSLEVIKLHLANFIDVDFAVIIVIVIDAAAGCCCYSAVDDDYCIARVSGFLVSDKTKRDAKQLKSLYDISCADILFRYFIILSLTKCICILGSRTINSISA